MELTGTEFCDAVKFVVLDLLPAREIVEKAITERNSIDSSGEIILLEQSCMWKEHLFEIEKELDIVGKIKYVIYYDGKSQW